MKNYIFPIIVILVILYIVFISFTIYSSEHSSDKAFSYNEKSLKIDDNGKFVLKSL
jgi:uncharacterized alpha/beta hydrolase family protein